MMKSYIGFCLVVRLSRCYEMVGNTCVASTGFDLNLMFVFKVAVVHLKYFR